MARPEDIQWAMHLTAGAQLGDVRRNRRAADVVVALMDNPGVSLAQAARGEDDAREQYYRHARAKDVDPDELLAAGCRATAEDVVRDVGGDILLIGDTTTLSYRHAVCTELGLTSTKDDTTKARGWLVHTVLAVSASAREVIGPVAQLWWTRPEQAHGKSHKRDERPYDEKESLKWEVSSTMAAENLAAAHKRTILVTDRESDVYEYLVHVVGEDLRFIARCTWNRRITAEDLRIFEHLETQPVVAEFLLDVPQKGGRSARRAQLQLRKARVTLRPPKDVESAQPRLEVNVVSLVEVDAPEGVEPVRWVLLTSESIATVEDCIEIIERYACRWRIEEFHKFWKSEGMKVESLRMTTADNLRRIAILMSFAACRLMRLRDSVVTSISKLTRIHQPAPAPAPGCAPCPPELAQPPAPMTATTTTATAALLPLAPCTQILTQKQWTLLWVTTEKSPPPADVPSRRWAARAIAKLAGWTDTKRTGRPGYRTFVRGWLRLMDKCDVLDSLVLLTAVP